jgi:signal peptidase
MAPAPVARPRTPRLPQPCGAWVEAAVRVCAAAWSWTVLWLVVYATVGSWALGSRAVVIEGRSMEPAVNRGDVVLVARVSPEAVLDLKPGNVVVFADPAMPERLVTHRVMAVRADGSLITKGDNNRGLDSTPVPASGVRAIGRMVVPLVGLPLVWRSAGAWVPLAFWLGLTALAVPVSAGRWRWLSRVCGVPEAPRPAPGARGSWSSLLVGSASLVLVAGMTVGLASRATASTPAPTIAPRPAAAGAEPAPPGQWGVVVSGLGTSGGGAGPDASWRRSGELLERALGTTLVRDFQLEATVERRNGAGATSAAGATRVDLVGMAATDGSARFVVVDHAAGTASIAQRDPGSPGLRILASSRFDPVDGEPYQISFHALANGQLVLMILDADGALLGRIAVPSQDLGHLAPDPVHDRVVVGADPALVVDRLLVAGYRTDT